MSASLLPRGGGDLSCAKIFVANDIQLWSAHGRSSESKTKVLLETLVGALRFRRREVYESASEVCAMILAQFPEHGEVLILFTLEMGLHTEFGCDLAAEFLPLKDLLMQQLQELLSDMYQQRKYDIFLKCVNKIGLHYPEFLDTFLPTQIFNLLNQMQGVFR